MLNSTNNTFIIYNNTYNSFKNKHWLDKYLLATNKYKVVAELKANNYNDMLPLFFFHDILDQMLIDYLYELNVKSDTILASELYKKQLHADKNLFQFMKEYINTKLSNYGIIFDMNYNVLINHNDYLLFILEDNTPELKTDYTHSYDYTEESARFSNEIVKHTKSIVINSDYEKSQFIELLYLSVLKLYNACPNVYYAKFIFNKQDLINQAQRFYINLYNNVKKYNVYLSNE